MSYLYRAHVAHRQHVLRLTLPLAIYVAAGGPFGAGDALWRELLERADTQAQDR
jgi:hypothetical protein